MQMCWCDVNVAQDCKSDLNIAIEKLVLISESSPSLTEDLAVVVQKLRDVQSCLNENPIVTSSIASSSKLEPPISVDLKQDRGVPVFGRIPLKPATTATNLDGAAVQKTESNGLLILNSAVETKRNSPLSVRLH